MEQSELLETIERAEREQWTELNLRGKGLTSLPETIGNLTNLTELYLD